MYYLLRSLVEHSCVNPKSLAFGYLDEKPFDIGLMKFLGLCPSALSWSKGSIGHAFTVRIRTGNQNQTSFYPFVPHEISVLVELILGHLRYLLTDVPPQPNSPPDNVFRPDRPARQALGPKGGAGPRLRLTE
ncbi:hypothetical protein OPV22_034839 [Ensete ventricosum]|uniref:Regulator of rDNA transcription protein 15 n=1 Tax=Ensete ventricosum TaxID=4639 RepID=A0AAV8PQM8_ENSVE|nr:hypothetical protein OPV22_034839 [Ensete ventricosum]